MTDERHTVEPSALSEDSVLRIGKKRAVLLIAG
jgi:hypothetical protein